MNRRGFLKACAVTIASVGLVVIIPNAVVLGDIQPIPGKKRKFSDRNLVCRSYIRDYKTGATVKWQDLTKDQGCEKCTYESTCIYSGTRFQFDTDKTRTFMPEMWDGKYLNEFINIPVREKN